MHTFFTSPKGGNGTTVVAVSHALLRSARGHRTLLLDWCGDVPAVLGIPEPRGPGMNEWLSDAGAGSDALLARATAVNDALLLVHRGGRFIEGAPRWDALADLIAGLDADVVIDGGTGAVPDEVRAVVPTVAMVTRPCYLSLRRASSLPRPTSVYVMKEGDRALTVNDVAHVLGVPVAATVPHTAAIARAVDAGLLPSRVEHLLGRHLPVA
jgi:hypothetical protein